MWLLRNASAAKMPPETNPDEDDRLANRLVRGSYRAPSRRDRDPRRLFMCVTL